MNRSQELIADAHIQPYGGYLPHTSSIKRFLYLNSPNCSREVNLPQMYELLIARVEIALKKAGMKANAASIASGLDRGFVGKLGRPRKDGKIPEPGALTLKKLASTLGVPASWLLDAIDPDEAEIARGTSWPPLERNTTPEPGEFVKDPDELALLAFWRPLDEDKRDFMLALLRNGALNARRR